MDSLSINLHELHPTSLPPEVCIVFYSEFQALEALSTRLLYGTTETKLFIHITLFQIEEGNVEYKLKLINPSEYRIEHLVTQMKWRLNEGGGEAIYEIGVADNGELAGLTEDDMNASMKTLGTMASKCIQQHISQQLGVSCQSV